VAVTLRAVRGLTTREIADAFYVPEATMAQRISRAKRAVGHMVEESTALPSKDRRVRGSRGWRVG
jgi:predicted RNA polymerase sigma factor